MDLLAKTNDKGLKNIIMDNLIHIVFWNPVKKILQQKKPEKFIKIQLESQQSLDKIYSLCYNFIASLDYMSQISEELKMTIALLFKKHYQTAQNS